MELWSTTLLTVLEFLHLMFGSYMFENTERGQTDRIGNSCSKSASVGGYISFSLL